jgi:hypothetical protein
MSSVPFVPVRLAVGPYVARPDPAQGPAFRLDKGDRPLRIGRVKDKLRNTGRSGGVGDDHRFLGRTQRRCHRRSAPEVVERNQIRTSFDGIHADRAGGQSLDGVFVQPTGDQVCAVGDHERQLEPFQEPMCDLRAVRSGQQGRYGTDPRRGTGEDRHIEVIVLQHGDAVPVPNACLPQPCRDLVDERRPPRVRSFGQARRIDVGRPVDRDQLVRSTLRRDVQGPADTARHGYSREGRDTPPGPGGRVFGQAGRPDRFLGRYGG